MISKDSVILKQRRNIRRLNTDRITRQAVKANTDTIVQLNRDQMRGSMSGDGLLPEYSQLSLSLKDFDNYKGIFPRFDLYDTGSFQDKMFMSVQGNDWLISSRDSKTDDLVMRLGDEIFELNPNSLQVAQQVVTKDWNKLIHEAINK